MFQTYMQMVCNKPVCKFKNRVTTILANKAEKILEQPEPVSYTHLDVYKRQE